MAGSGEVPVRNGRRIACMLSAAVFVVMAFSPLMSVRAALPDTIMQGVSYTFYDATGGYGSGLTVLTDGRYGGAPGGYVTTGWPRAEASSLCVGGSLGATGTAEVWKIVNCGESGFYYTTIHGYYWGITSFAGGAVPSILFKAREKNVDTGQVETSVTVRDISSIMNVQGYYDATFVWWGDAGTHYALEVYVKAYTVGLIGSAIADALGEQGINYMSIDVWSDGGGCVLSGTNVAMSDGTTKIVDRIKIGDSVAGFDTASNSPVVEQVTVNNMTRVNIVEVINNGALTVTPLNQPVYARNEDGTFVGWIENPADLKVNWSLFCPSNQSWVPITDIHWETGNFKVYDLGTTILNNYIANGFLVDRSKTK